MPDKKLFVYASFLVEGKSHRPLRFAVEPGSSKAEIVQQIRVLVAQEMECDEVDVEVLSIGKLKADLQPAPAIEKTYPTPSEVAGMLKANLQILAGELGIEGNFSSIKKDDLAKLINEKIEEIQTAPAK